MSNRERRLELSQFLQSRRQRISPRDAGLPVGTRRRTPGLRREELALLAGVGATWYTWLEQGRDITVSEQVLESLAHVLQLNADERDHLFILARQQLPIHALPLTQTIEPAFQLILDTMGIYPAYIVNTRLDVIAWNQATSHLYADFTHLPPEKRNVLWFLFMHPAPRKYLHNWEEEAKETLALFRASTERYVGESWYINFVEEMKQVSPQFEAWWPQHDIQGVHNGKKEWLHPLVGQLIMEARTMEITSYPDVQMMIYTPAPDTDTASRLLTLSQMQP